MNIYITIENRRKLQALKARGESMSSLINSLLEEYWAEEDVHGVHIVQPDKTLASQKDSQDTTQSTDPDDYDYFLDPQRGEVWCVSEQRYIHPDEVKNLDSKLIAPSGMVPGDT